jgi:hypothetical protein
MSMRKALFLLLACALLVCACDYIVLPEGLEPKGGEGSGAWSAVVTSVGKSDTGDLKIDLALRNDTGKWSAMQAADKPALLKGDGTSTACDTVWVGTGGQRLAPGFQMRGYTGGTKAEPATQLVYVECKGGEAATGSTLSIDYSYVTGDYNYYNQDAGRAEATLEVSLDEEATALTYPVATPVEGLIQKPGTEIVAINNVALTLTQVERSGEALVFHWQTQNPGEYPTYVHVGNPPVIGDDGIVYGFYQTPDIVSVPITPAGDKTEWTTQVAVPADVKGLYLLLSVESGKQRQFTFYAVDLTGQ